MKLIFSFRNRDAPRTLVGIHEFGSPDVIRIDDVPQPTPNEGEILVGVAAAGVGPWDALLREGKIAVSSPLHRLPRSCMSMIEQHLPRCDGNDRAEAASAKLRHGGFRAVIVSDATA